MIDRKNHAGLDATKVVHVHIGLQCAHLPNNQIPIYYYLQYTVPLGCLFFRLHVHVQ